MKISKFNLLYLFEISKFIIANIILRTILKKSKNSQTHQIPEDYISKFSKPRISRWPEKSKNSQIRISKIAFQNFQSHEYILYNGQKNIKILKDQNFEDCISKLSKHEYRASGKKSKNFQSSISRLPRENYISKFSKIRISRLIGIGIMQKSRISQKVNLTKVKKIQKFSKIRISKIAFQNCQSHEYYEGQKNSQVRILKTVFQNFQNHEYHSSRWPEKSKNSQRFSKLNYHKLYTSKFSKLRISRLVIKGSERFSKILNSELYDSLSEYHKYHQIDR